MGFLPSFASCFRNQRVTAPQKLSTLPASWLGGGVESHTGEEISPDKALSSPAYFAAVRRVAVAEAMLPFVLMERDRVNRNVNRVAYEKPLYTVLHDLANPEQTAFDFRSRMSASRFHYGVAYAEMVRNRFGEVTEMWQMRSDRTRVERKNGELHYYTTIDGKEYHLFADQVFRLDGFSTWGILGLIPVATIPDAMAIDLAQIEYYARFFAANGVPPALIETEGSFDDQDDADQFVKDFQANRAGLSKSHRIAILEDGMKFREIGISPEGSQLIDGRRFQLNDICRVTDCAPGMIFEFTKQGFNSSEMEFLSFLVLSLAPVFQSWEQEVSRSALSVRERELFHAKHNPEGLLRMDSKAKAEFLKTMFMIGSMTLDEIRAKLDMNPYENGLGDSAYVPINMIRLSEAENFAKSISSDDGSASARLVEGMRKLIAAAGGGDGEDSLGDLGTSGLLEAADRVGSLDGAWGLGREEGDGMEAGETPAVRSGRRNGNGVSSNA